MSSASEDSIRKEKEHDLNDESVIEVSWDGENDKMNPLNWTTKRKIAVITLVSCIAFSTPFSADVSAPAIPAIMSHFHSNSLPLGGFVVSIYNLGNAIGPLIFAPASECYGRSLIFHISNITFVAFTLGCALSTSLPMLFVFRFLAGCAGAASLSVGGGTIADLIEREKRGRYFALFALGPQIAPIVGPIVGGFITEGLSWRWTFWIVVIVHGVITVSSLILLRETYGPVVLQQKASKIAKESGKKTRVKGVAEESSYSVFKRAIVRPPKIFFQSPIVAFLAIFQAIVFGYRYIMYTTIPAVFTKQYHFGTGVTGLAYIGNGIGASIALWIITRICDKLVISYKEKHDGKQAPAERRLIPMIWGSPLCPIGLFWYGWSAQARVQWSCPIIATLFFGAGITAASLPSNLYMVDAFTEYAASGLAASFFLRSVAGGVLPLAGLPLYDRLGIGWGTSLLAFIALACCAIPPVIYKYGEQLRLRYPVKL